MVLKLTVLHVLNERQIVLRYKILVHIQQNVSYHINAHFGFFPFGIEFFEETIFVSKHQLVCNWPKQLNRRLLYIIVKHLAMLVKYKMICSPVELFIAESTRLFHVDLVDGVLDCLPVCGSLISAHIGFTHLIAINQEFVLRKSCHFSSLVCRTEKYKSSRMTQILL